MNKVVKIKDVFGSKRRKHEQRKVYEGSGLPWG